MDKWLQIELVLWLEFDLVLWLEFGLVLVLQMQVQPLHCIKFKVWVILLYIVCDIAGFLQVELLHCIQFNVCGRGLHWIILLLQVTYDAYALLSTCLYLCMRTFSSLQVIDPSVTRTQHVWTGVAFPTLYVQTVDVYVSPASCTRVWTVLVRLKVWHSIICLSLFSKWVFS